MPVKTQVNIASTKLDQVISGDKKAWLGPRSRSLVEYSCSCDTNPYRRRPMAWREVRNNAPYASHEVRLKFLITCEIMGWELLLQKKWNLYRLFFTHKH